ncbi:MAG: FkbM family methyltransferase [Paracoccaceae bacterium]
MNENEERWKFLAEGLGLDRLTDVVDIGANPLDDPPYKPLLDAKLCRVHGFEPQPEAFEKLQQTKSDLETYYDCAVGNGKKQTLNIYQQSGLSSVFELDMESIEFLGRSKRAATLREQVPLTTRRLDKIDGITNIDLLKIDVQGAESMIFDSGKSKLKDAVAVVTELRFFPLYYDEKLQDAQINRLAAFGLMFHKLLFVKSKMISNSQAARLRPRALQTQAIDGDAVFVKDLRDPDKISDAQLGHLAMLSDAVFASYDLTIRCIDLLALRKKISDSLAAEYVEYLPAHVRR